MASTPGLRLRVQPGIGSQESHAQQRLYEALQHSARKPQHYPGNHPPHKEITPRRSKPKSTDERQGQHKKGHIHIMLPSPASKRKSSRRLPSYLRNSGGEPVGELLRRLREEAREAAQARD